MLAEKSTPKQTSVLKSVEPEVSVYKPDGCFPVLKEHRNLKFPLNDFNKISSHFVVVTLEHC